MQLATGTTADHLTDDELDFLLQLARHGRRRLSRLLPGSEAAAERDNATESAAGNGSQPRLTDPAPTSASARSLVLQRARAGETMQRSRGRFSRPSATVTALRDQLRRSNQSVLWYEQLPPCLRAIPDPPWALYARGEVGALAGNCIAIVGARAATTRALRWTQQLARELGEAGLAVVSGLALGIDAAAHRGCLAAAAPTIAVLGSGLDQPTPRQNARLAAAIAADGGLLLSEYPPGQTARAHHFPERNRLVSGLALGLLVVEASERSGSLISARLALEQGRELMAVPGPVGLPNSSGCHRLLRQGATLVTGAADVLEALGLGPVAPAEPRAAEGADLQQCFAPTDVQLAQQLYLACDAIAQPLATLVDAVQGEPARVAHLLTLLELHGFLKRAGTGYYRG